MPRYLTLYWQNETCRECRAEGGEGSRRKRLLSNQFRRMNVAPGDFIYSVTILDGDLYLLGRIEVAEVDDCVDIQLPSESSWRERAVARSSTPWHFENKMPLEVARALRFIKGKGNGEQLTTLAFDAPGHLDRQTLRGLRQLTPDSAAALDTILDQYELRIRTERAEVVRSGGLHR